MHKNAVFNVFGFGNSDGNNDKDRPVSVLSRQSNKSTDSAVKILANALKSATTTRAKTAFNYFKLTTAVVAPLAAVCVLCAITLINDQQQMQNTVVQEGYVKSGQSLANLIGALQRERGTACQYLQSLTQENKDQAYSSLLQRYNQTDQILNSLTTNSGWLANADTGQGFDTVGTFKTLLSLYRSSIGFQVSQCIPVLSWYTDKTTRLAAVISGSFRNTVDGAFWATVSAYGDLLTAKDLYGICRALGGSFFAAGGFSNSGLIQFAQTYGAATQVLQNLLNQTPNGVQLYKNMVAQNQDLMQEINTAVSTILSNNVTQADSVGGLAWFNNMTSYITLLDSIGTAITDNILVYLDQTMASAQQNILTTIIIVVVIGVVCPPIMIWYSVNNQRLMTNIRGYVKLVFSKTEELNREKKRTEIILSQILPVSIVADLKQNKKIVPENYDNVTIYFSDVYGFAALAFKSTPMEIVEFLNSLYTTLDAILDRYDVYKVETISDSYMVVSGLPHRNGNRHSDEVCTMALDILMIMDEFYIPHLPTDKPLIRIGIHTGPCAAGVVGLKMPRFCLFGDTVNTASRMETTGEPWKIQITSKTKDSFDRDGDNFDVAARGTIDVKGKGQLLTFWLLGKKGFPYRVDLDKASAQPEIFTYWKI